MHGKSWVSGGEEKSFHRLTAIELVVKPHYRIYYAGPHTEELSVRLRSRQSHYHTYLGSAYCLTFPQRAAVLSLPEPECVDDNAPLTCETVVPSQAIKRLLPRQGDEYGRVGGVLWEHIGDRKFRGTVSLLYAVNGGALQFLPVLSTADAPWKFYRIPDEGVVCLW
jgi:CRISPR-associated protein Cas5h